MLYDLVNMSDAITFEADDVKIAAIAVILVGGGQYSARPIDEDGNRLEGEEADKWEVPFFMFGGTEAWFKAHGEDDCEGIADRHAEAVAKCLDTFTLGNAKDRAFVRDALAAIDDPEKRKAFRDKWDDKKRSSLNDICGRAATMAAAFRERTGTIWIEPPRQVFSR